MIVTTDVSTVVKTDVTTDVSTVDKLNANEKPRHSVTRSTGLDLRLTSAWRLGPGKT